MNQKLSTPIEQKVVGPHIRHPNPHPQYATAEALAAAIATAEAALAALIAEIAEIELTPGPQGDPGTPGTAGDTGATGVGIPGVDGEEGPEGIPGVPGIPGAVGQPGSLGPPGDDGAEGSDGPPGIAGAVGAPGAPGIGISGEDGEDGPQGPPGAAGVPGAAGSPGIGIAGEDGADGPQGPPGGAGVDGAAGAAGVAGTMGPPGTDGDTGDDGLPGPRGADGTSGSNGATGAQGPTGPPVYLLAEPGDEGERGPPGPQGTAGGGGGTPGGSDTQVQFNDSGSFGGDAGMVYDKTNNQLAVGPGTAALPAFAFPGDLNTGWSNLTADTIDGSVGGVEVFTMNATNLTYTGAYIAGDGNVSAPSYVFASRTDIGPYFAYVGGSPSMCIGVGSIMAACFDSTGMYAKKYMFTSAANILTGMQVYTGDGLSLDTNGTQRILIDLNYINMALPVGCAAGSAATTALGRTGTYGTGIFFGGSYGDLCLSVVGTERWGISSTATTQTVQGIFPTSVSARASVQLPHGSAPSSPVDGDIWTTTTGGFLRVNGTTRPFAGGAETMYRNILVAAGSHIAGKVAGKYGIPFGDALAVSGTGTLYPIGIVQLVAADYPTINGVAPQLRIRAQLYTNDTAPTGNFTFGLYPVTRPGTSGGAGLCIYTIGTVISGSDGATFTTPAADLLGTTVGSDFAFPSDGPYCIAVVTTATVATNALVQVVAQLQIHNP